MCILIVDDSEDIRLLLESILRPAGYDDLLFAESANEAYEILGVGGEPISSGEAIAVDLVLMDVAMPSIDGIEACSRIKEDERLSDIPVVMVTALDEIKLLEVALDKGALDYITKPFNKVELLARIRAALRLKKEVDQRRQQERELVELTEALRKANKGLAELSYLDGLTSLANRRYFDEQINKEWRSKKRNNTPLSFILIDIDFFKDYNDKYGHLAGDDVLRSVAQRLKSTVLRPNDFVARYGGEEFAVILPQTDTKGAKKIAEDLRLNVESMKVEHSSGIGNLLTISLGVASYGADMHPNNVEEMIEAADKALYQAKKEGKNRVNMAAISQLMEKEK